MKIRLIIFFIFMVAFSGIFWLGSTIEVPQEEAELFIEKFKDLVEDIDGFGIFTHNTLLALPMFLPGIGIAWGLFSAFSTGMAFSAITTISPELQSINALEILYLSPFGIMELVSYSIGISRSYILMLAIIKKQSLVYHLKPTAIEIGILVVLLLAGGYLEFYLIEAQQLLQTDSANQDINI